MSIELVIHAPNAQALARAVLPWLAQAQFADSAPSVMAAIRRKMKQSVNELRILDVFGPNRNHPLKNPLVLSQLQTLLGRHGTINVVVLNIHPPQAGSFGGGQFAGFGRSADENVTAGFSGFSGSGFAGSGEPVVSSFGGGGFGGGFGGDAEAAGSLSHLAVAQAALGDRFRIRTVSSLAQARQSWDI